MAAVTIPIDNLSVTTDADQDILELIAGATCPIEIVSIELESDCITDERLRMRLVAGRSTTGSGGSAITGLTSDRTNTTTVHTTVNSLVTTPGTGGTVVRGFRWGQLNKLQYIPLELARPRIAAATRISLHLNTAVGSTRLWSGEMVINELG